MLTIKRHQTTNGPVDGVEIRLDQIEPWTPTRIEVREAVIASHVVGSLFANMPPDAARFAPDQKEVDVINELSRDAAQADRLIEFGDWTNDQIKQGGHEGGPLYTRGLIGHPFLDPYLFMHGWEGTTAVYLAVPLEPYNPGGDCNCIELLPIRLLGETALMIGDRCLLTPSSDGPATEWAKYLCKATPSVWRCLPGSEGMNNGMPPAHAAAGNVLDPLMTALLILSKTAVKS
jgi:hypothetical protein